MPRVTTSVGLFMTAVRDTVVEGRCTGGQFVLFREDVGVVSSGHFSKELLTLVEYPTHGHACMGTRVCV